MMGEETFHPDTRALLAYGRALAGAGGAAPKKGGADQVLERLFVIERLKDGRLPMRTFGAELVTLFGADLRHHDFARMFLAPDLALVNALISACEAAGEPGILRHRRNRLPALMGVEILLTLLKFDANSAPASWAFSAVGRRIFSARAILRLKLGFVHSPAAKGWPGRASVVND